MKPRPLTPAVFGVFFALSTLIVLSVGAALIWPGTFADSIWTLKPERAVQLMPHRTWLAPMFLSLGVVFAATSAGCFARRAWAWGLAIAIFAANGIDDIVQIAMGHIAEGLVGIAAAGVILFWLTRPRVRGLFV